MKKCSTCSQVKEVDAFNKGNGAFQLQNKCRKCQSAYQYARKWQPNPGKHRKKICVSCKQAKGLRNYYYSNNTTDGYRNRCKQCMKQEAMDGYYLKYESHLALKRQRYSENKAA